VDKREKLAKFRREVMNLAERKNLSNLDTLIVLSEVSSILLQLLKVEDMEEDLEEAEPADEPADEPAR
jgi:glutamine amidotransferase PdxT